MALAAPLDGREGPIQFADAVCARPDGQPRRDLAVFEERAGVGGRGDALAGGRAVRADEAACAQLRPLLVALDKQNRVDDVVFFEGC